MLVIDISLNRNKTIGSYGAVRISQINELPVHGDPCIYKVGRIIDGRLSDKTSTITYPYGDGVGLAIQMMKIIERDSL